MIRNLLLLGLLITADPQSYYTGTKSRYQICTNLGFNGMGRGPRTDPCQWAPGTLATPLTK